MNSTEIRLCGAKISCHLIFKMMLNNKGKIHWLGGPLEIETDTIHELEHLAVNNPHKLCFFGLYFPITKFSDL